MHGSRKICRRQFYFNLNNFIFLGLVVCHRFFLIINSNRPGLVRFTILAALGDKVSAWF